MSTTLEAVVGGETFDLSDGLLRAHLGNAGFGLPGVRRLQVRGPLQHGATDVGFRLEPRIIQLVLLAYGEDAQGYFDRRDELLYIFSPRDEAIKLRFTRPDGRVRQIDAFYQDGLGLDSSDRLAGFSQRVGVTLTCPDPTWYDPQTVTVNFGISAGSGAFDVPLTVPVQVGTSDLDQVKSVVYAGTWDAFPVLTVYGPVTDLVLVNQVSGDTLDFTGSSIAAGDYYTIDTRYGSKRVYRNGAIADNRIAELSTDSDLASFRLLRKPDAPGGVNAFQVTGSGANAQTAVYLTYNERFVGV
jgi:hypothetical protein